MVNFSKSSEPSCLKESKNYRCEEVLEQVKKDFRNKCYICESKYIECMNVEHFIPHRKNENLKLDWNNLFYSCCHCNNTKSATSDKKEFDNLLNCIKDVRVDESIRYEVKNRKVNLIALNSNEKVLNTLKLLNDCYLGITPQKKIESKNIVRNLTKELNSFYDLLDDYQDAPYDEFYINELKAQISIASPFCAFKRWIIRDNLKYKNLKQYID